MFAIVQSQTGVALRRRPSAASTRSGLRRSVRAAASGKKDAPKKEEEKDEPKIDMAGLSQLIKMGLGTISGDIKEINLDDPTRTVVMELEANNFEDADGNPLNFMNNEVSGDESWPARDVDVSSVANRLRTWARAGVTRGEEKGRRHPARRIFRAVMAGQKPGADRDTATGRLTQRRSSPTTDEYRAPVERNLSSGPAHR